MAKECDDSERIVRLEEVLFTDGQKFSSKSAFDHCPEAGDTQDVWRSGGIAAQRVSVLCHCH